MPRFAVQFEEVTYLDDRTELNAALDAGEAETLTEKLLSQKKKFFPAGILGVSEAYITEDDAQGDSDIKCFICIKLIIEATTQEAAEATQAPTELLSAIADDFGHSWSFEENWQPNTGCTERA
jgi:hypothetical protein